MCKELSQLQIGSFYNHEEAGDRSFNILHLYSSNNSNDNDNDMKWPVLQLFGQRDHLKTEFNFFSSYPNRSGN